MCNKLVAYRSTAAQDAQVPHRVGCSHGWQGASPLLHGACLIQSNRYALPRDSAAEPAHIADMPHRPSMLDLVDGGRLHD
eukprot:3910390-Prymnesium_polylepis.1